MDERMKRFIESAIDEMVMEKGDLLRVLESYLKSFQVKSFRDFALGYLIGASKSLASRMVAQREIYTGRMRHISDDDKLMIEELII